MELEGGGHYCPVTDEGAHSLIGDIRRWVVIVAHLECFPPASYLLRPRLHLPLRPALLQQPRQLPPRSGAHTTTPAPGGCPSRRTTHAPASSRVDGFKCRDSLVEAVALRTKFCKNPIGVHDGSSGGYPNRARRRLAKKIHAVGVSPQSTSQALLWHRRNGYAPTL